MTVGPISCYDCVLCTVLGSVHGRMKSEIHVHVMNLNWYYHLPPHHLGLLFYHYEVI